MGKIEGHPIHVPPSWEDAVVEAGLVGCTEDQAFRSLVGRRRELILAEKKEPLRCGYEPLIWRVADALVGFDFCDKGFENEIGRRFPGWGWKEWKEKMREVLGFMDRTVSMLLILGMNRSSKSEYSAKRCQLVLTDQPGSNVYPFHMSNPRSVHEQQPLFWKYMPPPWKENQVAGVEAYIKYKRKTGFSDSSFINPVGSLCQFLNYMQDRDTALEGLEPDLLAPDELVGPDWLETMRYRLSTRSGKAIVGFTPIHGYTPSVKIFCDNAEITRESVAFMLPKDGGPPDPARTLGLTEDEYLELWRSFKAKDAARAPQCRPEDCHAWLEQAGYGTQDPDDGVNRPFGYAKSQMDVPDGRKFHMVPRVRVPVDRLKAVLHFHCENPYGNPKQVIEDAVQSKKGVAEIRIRVYGDAARKGWGVFSKFLESVHVVPDEAIPTAGTNYYLLDPASKRNPFMSWIRACKEASFVHREWPGNYDIPGEGVPGPWAIPSGRKEGRNDGARGEGAESFGFGLVRWKFEIARLERWEAYLKWLHDDGDKMAGLEFPYPHDDEILKWDERDGAEEVIEQRYVDSRAASSPRVENDRPVTLHEELNALGFDFVLTPGEGITDGVNLVVSALDYKMDEEQSFFNKPHLFIAASCLNTIFSMGNWLNVDGQEGACKDPADLVRYFFMLQCGYCREGRAKTHARPSSGFAYGRGPRGGGSSRAMPLGTAGRRHGARGRRSCFSNR